MGWWRGRGGGRAIQNQPVVNHSVPPLDTRTSTGGWTRRACLSPAECFASGRKQAVARRGWQAGRHGAEQAAETRPVRTSTANRLHIVHKLLRRNRTAYARN